MWRRQKESGDGNALPGGGQAASALALHFQRGGQLAPVQVEGLALAEGEAAYADVQCAAARFYGTEVVHRRTTGYYENHPAFGRQWVPNPLDARRQRDAEAAAQPQWRDHTPARLVLTSAGVRLRPPGSEWLPFDHSLLTAVTPDGPGLVLTYSVCAPLLITGPAAPWLGVAIEHLHRTG